MDGSAAHVALAIPAYNEEGLPEFLREIDLAFSDLAVPPTVVVVDDCSRRDVAAMLSGELTGLRLDLRVVRNEVNLGHGPSVRRAYALAARSGACLVLQVDGDGQFYGEDLRSVLDAVAAGADAAVAVRVARADPWFRRALSRALRRYLARSVELASADPNCPLRCYRARDVEAMLALVPERCLIPNVYLSVLAGRLGLHPVEVPVRHRARLGTHAQGTTWGATPRRLLVPRRLLAFTWQAYRESRRFLASLPPAVPSPDPEPAAARA